MTYKQNWPNQLVICKANDLNLLIMLNYIRKSTSSYVLLFEYCSLRFINYAYLCANANCL